jgi:hypothetical protein
VLLHRAFMLLVLLLGVGLGLLLPRPWAEVPEVEAARPARAVFRCFGIAAVLHNPTDADMRVAYEHLGVQGTTTGAAEVVIAPRTSSSLHEAAGVIVYVTAPKAAYVAGVTSAALLSECQVGK